MNSYQRLIGYAKDNTEFSSGGEFNVTAKEHFANDLIAHDAFRMKYAITEQEREFPAFAYWRVALYIASADIDHGETSSTAFKMAVKFFDYMWDRDLVIGGRIMYGAGNPAKVSLINCTTVELTEDSLEAIWEADYKIAKVESRGEGVGIDFSALRPRGSSVNNAAKTTSGAVSWMAKPDQTTATIAQEGRRGALLMSLKVSHPDIPEFIKVKSDLNKIKDANISIQITDDFMLAYLSDEMWTFHWESKDGKQVAESKMRATEVMRLISEHSAKFAEPGLQFFDTARRYSNSDAIGYPVISTNACSEQWLTDLDSCVLGHINWGTLPVNQDDAEELVRKRAYHLSHFLDNVVTKQLVDNRSPLPGSAEKSRLLRRIGAGSTGVADYLAIRNVTYASPEGTHIASRLTRAMTMGSYERSIMAGNLYGSFEAFDLRKFRESRFIKEMIADGVIESDFKFMRNVCNNTFAPVGTGMLMVNGWANGAEPGLGFIYWRRTRISGAYVWYFVVNPFVYQLINDKDTVKALKHLVDLINTLEPGPRRFAAEEEAIEMIRGEIDYDTHKFSHEIDPIDKACFIGALQKYVDSAISITFNMPNSTTVEQIEALYVEAWKQKLKGISIYREDPENRPPIFQFTRPTTFNYEVKATHTGYRVRPQQLPGYTERVKAEGYNFYFTYNLDSENSLYEVFAQTNAVEPKVNTEAALKSLGAMLAVNDHVEVALLESQNKKSAHQNSTTRVSRLVSLAIRNGIPIQTIVDALNEVDVTVSSYIYHLRRGLLKFVGTTHEVCPNCKADAMIVGGGCASCAECGYSKC